MIFYKKSSYRRARRIKLQANSEDGVFFTPARQDVTLPRAQSRSNKKHHTSCMVFFVGSPNWVSEVKTIEYCFQKRWSPKRELPEPSKRKRRQRLATASGCAAGIGDIRFSVMLTSENIVVLRACACSASKLLIFVISRRKTTLSCFSRSPTDFAYLSRKRAHDCEP